MEKIERNPPVGKRKNILKVGLIFLGVIMMSLGIGSYLWMIYHPCNIYFERSEWGAESPNQEGSPLNPPVGNVVIYHTATEECYDKESCSYSLRDLQTYQMQSLNWNDIAFNFLVGGDGEIYEGRGWDIKDAQMKASISIAFIGTFSNREPPLRQIDAAKRLMDEGVHQKKLHPDYHIYARRQLYPTESPGQKLYELLQTWPRWTNEMKYLTDPLSIA